MRWLNTILLVFVIALLGTILWLMLRGHPLMIPGDRDAHGLEYKDFLSIVLTALAVMIAVATILLAALAVFGYGILKDEAKREAGAIAARTARDLLPVQTSPDDANKIAASPGSTGDKRSGAEGAL